MPIPLFIPIFILALGALVLLLLGTVARFRFSCIIAAGYAGLSLISLLVLRVYLPVGGVASQWRPLGLFGAPLTFSADNSNWALAAALITTSLLALLCCCFSTNRPTSVTLALILALTGVGTAGLFASSFVALVVAWGVTDLLLSAAMIQYGKKGARRAGLTLVSGILATTALWAAPLLAQAEGTSGFLHLTQFTGVSATLLQIAVILRLGLVPFHLWRPMDLDTDLAQFIPLIAIPTLLGFDLLTYLPALAAGLPPVFLVLAALTVLIGGYSAWSETEERFSLAGMAMAETGLVVLAVANAEQQAVAIATAGAIAWAVGTTVFSLTPGWSGRQFWKSAPSLLAVLSLLSLPATLGFVVRFAVYDGLEADLPALAVALLGEAFVVAALLRLWFWAEPRPLPRRRLLELLYLSVFAVAAAVLIVLGLFPNHIAGRGEDSGILEFSALIGAGSIAGWAGWALPLVAGLTLFLVGEGLRQRLEGGWRGLGALLWLEWVYGLLYLGARGVVRFVRGISSVIEGEGALLWTAVVLLIILLYLVGNGGPPG